jgi:hypothetical protein
MEAFGTPLSARGERYQIVGRFAADLVSRSWAYQDDVVKESDFLVVVIFDERGGVECAHRRPSPVVRAALIYGAPGQWWLTFGPKLWAKPGVTDITAAVRAVVHQEIGRFPDAHHDDDELAKT